MVSLIYVVGFDLFGSGKTCRERVNFVYFLWNVKSVMVAKSVIYLKRLNSAKKT